MIDTIPTKTMPLSIYSNGQCSSGYCKIHTENDEEALLYCASFDGSQMDSPYRLRKGSSSTQSDHHVRRYNTLDNGTHRHCLPPWSCQNHRSGKERRRGSHFFSDIKCHDPDMSLPFDSVLSASSAWFNKIKEKSLGTRQETLSKKYDFQEDILNDSSSQIRIYLVRDKSFPSSSKEPGRYFAAKVFVRPRQNSLKTYLRRVTAEFCIAHTLQHPNVVRVLELLPNENSLCEIMEFCDAGSLLDILDRATKLESSEADCFFKQLLHGVQYIHSVGVSHRNLKPENILLTCQGTLKITDFCYAECFQMPWAAAAPPPSSSPSLSSKTRDDIGISTQNQYLKGTIPFMAPEQFVRTRSDPRYVGCGQDMWACGIIYFAMRSGRLPWRRATYEDDLYQNYLHDLESGRQNKYIEHVSGGPRQSVLYSILQPVPERRLTATQALDSDWMRGIKLCAAAAGSDNLGS